MPAAGSWCTYPEINDIGLTPVVRDGEVGYSLRVGGGLSNEPHLAVRLDAFVRPDQAVRVARGVTEIFRDQQVLRESRERARLKYLFMREGWTPESFLDELQRADRLQARSRLCRNRFPTRALRDHVGIHPQRQPGLAYVGASVLRGRMTGEQLEAAAELAERFGSGSLRATVSQNLVIVDVPYAKTGELAHELGQIGLHVEGSPFWRGAIACTGTEFCKLAITETKGFTRWLVDELEERLPQFDQQLKLHVTGCPNGCGQHWIADIGLEGKKIKHEGKLDRRLLLLPGRSGGPARGHRAAGGLSLPRDAGSRSHRAPAARLPGGREPEENLRAWFARHTNDELRAQLAGEVLEAGGARPAHRPRAARRRGIEAGNREQGTGNKN